MKRFMRVLALTLALVLVMGSIPAMAASKTINVATQAELDAALSSGKYTKVVIKTSKELTFKVAEAKYSKVYLYVKAAKATVENGAVFKKVVITDAAVYTEKASGNTIKVSDKKITLNVAKGAKVKTLSLAKKGASDTLTNEGTITTLKLSSQTTLDIDQKGTVTKAYIYKPSSKVNISGSKVKSLIVKEGGENSTITSSAPVKVTLYDGANVTLNKGAEGSSVVVKEAELDASIVNNTAKSVSVTGADSKKKTVAAGDSLDFGEGSGSTVVATPTAAPTATPTPEPTATPTPEPTATPTPEPSKMTVRQTATDAIVIQGSNIASDLEQKDVKLDYLLSGIELPDSNVIKDIAFSGDSMTVTLFSPLRENTNYIVKVAGETVNFTSASCKLEDVARIEIETKTAAVDSSTDIKLKYYDKNDVDLTSLVAVSEYNIINYGEATLVGSLLLEQKSGLDYAYLSGNSIYFSAEGSAQISAVLITKMDSEGKLTKIPTTGTIIGKKPQAKSVIYSIVEDDGLFITNTEKVINKVLPEEETVYVSLEAIMVMEDGTYKPLKASEYYAKVADEKIAMVIGSTSSDGFRLTANNIGETAVFIYDDPSLKTPIATCPISVKEKRKPQTLDVTPGNGNLNVDPSVGDSIKFTVVVKDQYQQVIENPDIVITQLAATISNTGTVNPSAISSVAGGSFTIVGTDVTITGKGDTIVLEIACKDTNLKKNVSIKVKDNPYSSSEKYSIVPTAEGPTVLDTAVTISAQKDVTLNIYAAYKKDNYMVKEEAGTMLDSRPVATLKASDLGIAAGTTALFYTISYTAKNTSAVYLKKASLPSNIAITPDIIEVKPITTGSLLPVGSYVVEFFEITAKDDGCTPNSRGRINFTVVDNNEFEYNMIANSAEASGTIGDILSKFYTFTWNGEKVEYSYITDWDKLESTSKNTLVKSITITFVNNLYGVYSTKQELKSPTNLITIK